MSTLDLANESFDLGRYADAEQNYLQAMTECETISDRVADSWFACRGYRSIEDARAVLRANPESSAAYRVLFLVLQREREYEEAVRVAATAVARFGESERERLRFVHYRFEAAVRGARLHATDWQEVRGDLTDVWNAYSRHEAESQRKAGHRLQNSIIRQLLQILSPAGLEVLIGFAAEIEHTHPQYAQVLRAHAGTIELFIRA